MRFSDNPKMDRSGLSVRETTELYMGGKYKKVTGPVVPGGEIRLAAQHAGLECGVTITDMESLEKIAALVGKGESLYSAARDVAREAEFVVHGSIDRDRGY